MIKAKNLLTKVLENMTQHKMEIQSYHHLMVKMASARSNKTLMKTLWPNCDIKSDENMKLSDIQGHLSHVSKLS